MKLQDEVDALLYTPSSLPEREDSVDDLVEDVRLGLDSAKEVTCALTLLDKHTKQVPAFQGWLSWIPVTKEVKTNAEDALKGVYEALSASLAQMKEHYTTVQTLITERTARAKSLDVYVHECVTTVHDLSTQQAEVTATQEKAASLSTQLQAAVTDLSPQDEQYVEYTVSLGKVQRKQQALTHEAALLTKQQKRTTFLQQQAEHQLEQYGQQTHVLQSLYTCMHDFATYVEMCLEDTQLLGASVQTLLPVFGTLYQVKTEVTSLRDLERVYQKAAQKLHPTSQLFTDRNI